MRKALALIAFVFFLCLPVKAQTQQQPIRVKCGGSAYTDSKGQAWATDYDFSGGMVFSIVVDGRLSQGVRPPRARPVRAATKDRSRRP